MSDPPGLMTMALRFRGQTDQRMIDTQTKLAVPVRLSIRWVFTVYTCPLETDIQRKHKFGIRAQEDDFIIGQGLDLAGAIAEKVAVHIAAVN